MAGTCNIKKLFPSGQFLLSLFWISGKTVKQRNMRKQKKTSKKTEKVLMDRVGPAVSTISLRTGVFSGFALVVQANPPK